MGHDDEFMAGISDSLCNATQHRQENRDYKAYQEKRPTGGIQPRTDATQTLTTSSQRRIEGTG